MNVQPANDSTDIFEEDAEQEEIHVVKISMKWQVERSGKL